MAARAWTLGILIMLACPPAADAATVSIRADTLTYVAGVAEANVVDVTRYLSSYGNGYRISEDSARLRVGPGCRRVGPREAVCLEPIRAFRAVLGSGNDLITIRDVEVPANVNGGSGADLIESGSAADRVYAGTGTDTVVGHGGDDAVTGGEGGDLLQGGDGADNLDGQSGDDVAMGQTGSGDQLTGGDGKDLLIGGTGNDQLSGDTGADALIGGAGIDRLDGGAGNDNLTDTDSSAGSLNCGAGDDAVRVSGDVKVQDCGGATRAPATAPAVWPPYAPAAARIAQLPPRRPPVFAFPRTRGSARYLSVRVDDPNYWRARVQVRFYDRERKYVGLRTYRVYTRNPQNVYNPPPPRRAYSATGRCCF